jgi:polyphosphate kinase
MKNDFVLLSSIIHANAQQLFTGMEIDGCYQFRVTRNADMWVDEEEIDDLLTALKGELHGRQFGASIRLEVADNCPSHIATLLLKKHNLNAELHLFQVSGPVNLHRLGEWVNLLNHPTLKYPPYSPGVPEKLGPKSDIFDIVRNDDILLHHPYRSFNPVVDMLWKVSEDPDVLSVKMTLYRVGKESPITDALIAAARANKDVTVIVELRARFDEAANIRLAQKLTAAGAKIVYGIVNYKCHAKLMMIVRREGTELRRYVHVGTGNYHINNARLYTDYSLMTSDPVIGDDVHRIFQQLTGLSTELPLKKLFHAPFTLRKHLVELIELEGERARKGEEAWIIAKMNSLTEASVIKALYRASQSGVRIRLIIRGICSLRPGLPNLSENIEVRSVVGRFLEHHRCYIFSSGGDEKYFIASADWMDRNLHRRVEVSCPITDPVLQKRLKYEMELYLKKTKKTWVMNGDGSYTRLPSKGIEAQEKLMRELGRK